MYVGKNTLRAESVSSPALPAGTRGSERKSFSPKPFAALEKRRRGCLKKIFQNQLRQPLFLGEIGIKPAEKRKKQRTKPEGQAICLSKSALFLCFYMLCSTRNKQVVSQPAGLYFIMVDCKMKLDT